MYVCSVCCTFRLCALRITPEAFLQATSDINRRSEVAVIGGAIETDQKTWALEATRLSNAMARTMLPSVSVLSLTVNRHLITIFIIACRSRKTHTHVEHSRRAYNMAAIAAAHISSLLEVPGGCCPSSSCSQDHASNATAASTFKEQLAAATHYAFIDVFAAQRLLRPRCLQSASPRTAPIARPSRYRPVQ